MPSNINIAITQKGTSSVNLSGNVGINSASPTGTLDVEGGTATSGTKKKGVPIAETPIVDGFFGAALF